MFIQETVELVAEALLLPAEGRALERLDETALCLGQRAGAGKHVAQHPPPLDPGSVLLEDFKVAAEPELEREVAHEPREEAVEGAQAEPVHRVGHRAQHPEKVVAPEAAFAGVARELGRPDRIPGRRGELVEDLVEKLARRLAGERQRHDAFRGRSARQQLHKAVGQRVGLARPR